MTPSQIRRAALEELRVVAAGDPIAPEDDQLLARKYEGLIAILLKQRLADWGVSDDIPAYAELPVTQMLAYLSASSFGIAAERLEQLRQAGGLDLAPNQGGPSQAERTLRRLMARKPVSSIFRSTYF